MTCDTRRDGDSQLCSCRVDRRVQLLFDVIYQEHRGNFCAHQDLCLFHDTPQCTFSTEIGIDKQRALHQPVHSLEQSPIGTETLLLTDTLPNRTTVQLEYL